MLGMDSLLEREREFEWDEVSVLLLGRLQELD
jgi:hypothetical protein